MSEPVKIAEDLQEMYDFSQKHLIDANWNNLAVCNLIERVSAAEAALALANQRCSDDELAFNHANEVIGKLEEDLALAKETYSERVAQIVAHRVCCGTEHDAANGKLHGYCVVCGVPWPCEYAGVPPSLAACSKAPDGAQEAEGARDE